MRELSASIVYRISAVLSRLLPDSTGAAGDRRHASQEGTSCSEWNDAKMTAELIRQSFGASQSAHTDLSLYRSAPLQGAYLVLAKQQKESRSLSLCRYAINY